MNRPKLSISILLLLSLLALAACVAPPGAAPAGEAAATGEPAAEAGAPQRGGTLTIARGADTVLWDPKFTNDNDSLKAQGQVFATLLRNSPDGTELLPALAESYEISDDATSFTFKLHDNAAFCDGTPITANDVKWSFERAMQEDSAVSWQYPSNPQIEVVDDHNLTITLDKPNVAFPSYLTLWGMHILSQAHGEAVGDEGLANEALGSGPFCVSEWRKGEEVVLTPNPGYWDAENVYLDEVRLKVVGDDNARVLQVQTGEVDVALDIPYSQVDVLGQADGVEVGLNTLYGTGAIVLNTRTVPAFADLKVRQAMAHAIDRQAIVDAVLLGKGEAANSPFYGPGVLYWTDAYATPYDLEAAKQLMAESGFPDGFSAELTLQSGDSLGNQTAVILKDQLAELGIDLTISPVEPGTWWELWSGGTFEALYKLGTNDVIDPAENIPFDFWSTEEGGADGAFSGYHNDEIVRLSMEAEAELDSEVRRQLYDDLQRIAMEESPQLYLFHPSNRWATRDNVEGFSVFNTGLFRIADAWKSSE